MANGERVRRFGAALAKARQRANLTQSTLGATTDPPTPQSTMSLWERGESEPPCTAVFEIERALNLRAGALSRLLGYVPLGVEVPSSVEQAVLADPTLDDYRRGLLLSIYETLQENGK